MRNQYVNENANIKETLNQQVVRWIIAEKCSMTILTLLKWVYGAFVYFAATACSSEYLVT